MNMYDWIKTASILAIAVSSFFTGWAIGGGKAEAEGKAALAAHRLAVEEERRAAADSYGKALAEALAKYEQEVDRANALAARAAQERKNHEREAATLQKRIAGVTRGSTHIFSAEFVRLYNEAIGLSGDALSEALCASLPDGSAGAGDASCLRPLDRLNGVREADVLEHITIYGRRCRDLENQVRGWQAIWGDE